MGLAGESGEVVDVIKKTRFQGHALDVEQLTAELGDVQWYIVLLCDTLGITLQEVRVSNIAKLRKRYPSGFEAAQSISRKK